MDLLNLQNWLSLIGNLLRVTNRVSDANRHNWRWGVDSNLESKQLKSGIISTFTNQPTVLEHDVLFEVCFDSVPTNEVSTPVLTFLKHSTNLDFDNEHQLGLDFDKEQQSEPFFDNDHQLGLDSDNEQESKPFNDNEHQSGLDYFDNARKQRSKFNTVCYGSIGWQLTRQWIFQHFMKRQWLGIMAGSPGCLKTFVALRISQCLANAEPIAGYKTEQSDVHYVAAEGSDGIKCRLRALEELHGTVGERVSFSFRSVDLREQQHVFYLESVFAEHEERTGNKIGLLVLDTMSVNALGMDENSSKEVSKFLACCNQFAVKHDIAILIVHHFGKDGKLRGSSAIEGNVDFIWNVNRVENSTNLSSVLTVERCKDGEKGIGLKFELEVYDTGLKDQWNESITTLRVVDEQFIRESKFVKRRDDNSPKPRKPTKAELDGQWLLAQLRKHNEPLSLTFLKEEFSKVEKLTEDALYQRIKRAKEYLQSINAINVTKEAKDVVLELRNADENALDEIDQDDDYFDEF